MEREPYIPKEKTKEEKKAQIKKDILSAISIILVFAFWIWIGLNAY